MLIQEVRVQTRFRNVVCAMSGPKKVGNMPIENVTGAREQARPEN